MISIFGDFKVHAFRFTSLIQIEFYFYFIKRNRTFIHSVASQDFRQFIQLQSSSNNIILHYVGFSCNRSFNRNSIIFSFDDILCFFVSKSLIRKNHRSSEPLIHHLCFFIDFKNGRKGIFLFLRSQGASEIRQHFGQHRNDTIYQIN